MYNYIRHLFEIPKFIARPLFIIVNKINFRLNGISYGENLKVYNRLYLHTRPTSKIEIGDDFTFSSGANFNQISRNIRGSIYADWGGVIKIGNKVGISSSSIWAINSIVIGDRTIIGADTIIMDHNAHSLNYLERQYGGERKSAPIIIGNDVFIGCRCLILKGVTIGDRTVIGAGSVVKSDIPADCIAAGNPCRVIKCYKDQK